jgi:CubicO group peptidase (beta-lactamase class C family)
MAENGNIDFENVKEIIRKELVEKSLPSLAVAVARKGEIIWEEAFGWADRERRIPATPHTLYSLASISKPITTTGLMILKERGLLDLDAPINDYLGDAKLTAWVGDAKDATVRRVASHTSGLHLHYHFFYKDEPYRRPPMDETIRRYGHLIAPPGERYYYSNLGFGLLDYVISRLSGKTYPDFMRQEVFQPLGMFRSSVDIGPGLEPYVASRYGSDGVAYPFYDFDHPGGSAVFCSAHDLLRFGMFHLKTRLSDQKASLSDETLDEMQRSPTLLNGEAVNYGIGWGVNPDNRGYRNVSHGGGMGGVSTTLQLIPSEEIAVVALCNASAGLPFRIAEEILSALLPDYAEKRAQEQAEREQKSNGTTEEKTEEKIQPPSDLLGEWKGHIHTYQGDRPLSLRVNESGDVHAQIEGQLTALVNDPRWEDDDFSGEMIGDIGTEDTQRRPYHLLLQLKRRGEVLNGAVIARTHQNEEGGAPGKRVGNALSHFTELKKV